MPHLGQSKPRKAGSKVRGESCAKKERFERQEIREVEDDIDFFTNKIRAFIIFVFVK